MTAKKPKNLFQKLKEKVADKEEQFEYISVAVRLLGVFLEWPFGYKQLLA